MLLIRVSNSSVKEDNSLIIEAIQFKFCTESTSTNVNQRCKIIQIASGGLNRSPEEYTSKIILLIPYVWGQAPFSRIQTMANNGRRELIKKFLIYILLVIDLYNVVELGWRVSDLRMYHSCCDFTIAFIIILMITVY